MIHDSITLNYTIEFLNTLVKIDRQGVERLIGARVACSDSLVDHPTVQCGANEFGVLGLLNGLFGVYDDGPKEMYGPITAVFEDDGALVRFELTVPVEPPLSDEAEADKKLSEAGICLSCKKKHDDCECPF